MSSRPPRLLLFGGGWTEAGGIANRTRLLSREFASRGWEVRSIGRAGTLGRLAVHREERIVAVDVPGFGRPWLGGSVYLFMGSLLGLAWGRRTTVALCLQLSSPLTVASAAALACGFPVIASTTTSGEFSEVAYLERSRLRFVRRWFAARARWLIGQTAATTQELEQITDPSRIAVVPTPVVVPASTVPLPRAGRVAFVGRLSEEKQLAVLLAAWRAVVESQPHARLHIVGAGGGFRSAERQLRALVYSDPRLRETVTFKGEIEDVRSFLSEVDVFVLPSRTEGMSNALLEACAEARAVVATRIPANVAVLGPQYPHLVASGSTDELAAAIGSLLSDADLADESSRLARAAAEEHSVTTIVDKLESLIGIAVRER